MKTILASLAILLLLGAPPVSAQNWAANDVRSARQSGDVVPLGDVIRKLRRERGGRYVDARFVPRSSGKSEYHIDWEKDGRKFVYIVDAQSGRVIRTSGG